MYLIQLAFFSLIPINIYCYPFKGLEGLRYASGITNIFPGLDQIYLSSNFSSMGIQSNFLSNTNILLIPLLIVPLFAYPILKYGRKSKNIHTRPRCQRYGKSLAF